MPGGNERFANLAHAVLLIVFVFTLLIPTQIGSKDKGLSPKEQVQLAHNWDIAYRLVDYDYFSWIGSDSAMKYMDSVDEKLMQGWVVIGNADSCDVIFGSIQDTCLVSPLQVHFVGKYPRSPSLVTNCFPKNSPAFLSFKALTMMKSKHKDEFESDHVPYNSYVLRDGDTTAVYIFPGSTDDYLIFCGGYRSQYLGNELKIIDDRKLHGNPLSFKPNEEAEALFRTSSRTDLTNEVDIAQYLLTWKRAPNQIVITRKYIFNFSWDSTTNRPTVNTELNDN